MTRPVHELKSAPANFAGIWEGTKRFDVRLADRDFRVGDALIFREWHPDKGPYSGRKIFARIIYIEALAPRELSAPKRIVFGFEAESRMEEVAG